MLNIKKFKEAPTKPEAVDVERCHSTMRKRHTWRFYTPIAANLIASKNRKRFSPPIDADTLGDLFRRSRRCGSFENSCDKIAQPDGLAFLAIRSNKHRKSRERAHLANPDEFNRRYLTSQISAILAIGENRSRCTGHTWRFSPIAAIGV